MEKLDGKSMDIVSENIAKLKELFPDVFSEGKVDFEALEATQHKSDNLMRVVFRDNGFKNAEVKTNAIQILKQSGIDDVKSL